MIRDRKTAKAKGRTYRVGETYEILRGDHIREIGAITAIEYDDRKDILDYNRTMIGLDCGVAINLHAAHEYLRKVEAKRCDGCQHQGCGAWIRI